jgi:beta-lactamase regulating signal transducer with metallopeptidase domain
MAAAFMNATVYFLVETLINSLWQGAMLACIAWGLLRVIRRANAATRYAVLMATLYAALILPLLTTLSGHNVLNFGHIEKPLAARLTTFSTKTYPRLKRDYLSAGKERNEGTARTTPAETGAIDETGAVKEGDEVGAREATTVTTVRARRVIELPVGRWPVVLFLCWFLVAGYLTSRIVQGLLHIRRLRLDCTPVEPVCQSRLDYLMAADDSLNPVRVCYSTAVSMPIVAGLFKPVIIFPKELAAQLTDEEFDQIVLHELAHVRRRDAWTNLFQKLIEAALFFNPAIIWFSRQLNLEREIACDDWVISLTKESRRYVACLTKLAEFSVMPTYPALAPRAAVGKKQIFSRVESLLQRRGGDNPHLSRFAMTATGAVLLVTALCTQTFFPVLALTKGGARQVASRSELSAAHDGLPERWLSSKIVAAGDVYDSAGENGNIPLEDDARLMTDVARQLDYPNGKLFRAGDNRAADSNEVGTLQPQEAAIHNSAPAPHGFMSDTARSPVQPLVPAVSTQSASNSSGVVSVAQEMHGAPFIRQDNADATADLLRAIASLSSDHDKANALIEVVNVFNTGKMPANFFKTVATINSPWEQSRVMSAILSQDKLSRSLLIKVLNFSATIDSDVPKTNLLVDAAALCPSDNEVFSAYLRSVASIKSAPWKERALTVLLQRKELNEEALTQAILLAADGMGSRRSGLNVLETAMQHLSR